tara:strand:- start:430 stop:600 length:171 start_codon:yes stop_codon:yes gene_type:complete
MRLCIRELYGKPITIEVEYSDTMEMVRAKCEEAGMTVSEERLKKLYDSLQKEKDME